MKLVERGDDFMFALVIVGFSTFLVFISFELHEYQEHILAMVGTWFSVMIGYFFGNGKKKGDS